MLKEQSRLLATTTFLVDLALVGMAFVLAHFCRATMLPFLFPDAFPLPFYALGAYLPLLPWVLAIWGVLLLASDTYRSHRTVPLIDEARELARICAVGLVVLALAIYALRLDEWLLGQDEISRPWIVLIALFAGLLLLTEKLALRTLSRYVRAARPQLPHGADRRHQLRWRSTWPIRWSTTATGASASSASCRTRTATTRCRPDGRCSARSTT